MLCCPVHLASYLPDFRKYFIVIVALLGLLGGRGDVGPLGRHGQRLATWGTIY